VQDTVLRRASGVTEGNVLVFEHTDPVTGSKRCECLIRVDDDNMQIEVLHDAGTEDERATTTVRRISRRRSSRETHSFASRSRLLMKRCSWVKYWSGLEPRIPATRSIYPWSISMSPESSERPNQ